MCHALSYLSFSRGSRRAEVVPGRVASLVRRRALKTAQNWEKESLLSVREGVEVMPGRCMSYARWLVFECPGDVFWLRRQAFEEDRWRFPKSLGWFGPG